MNKFYAIDSAQLALLERITKRLYTEERLSGEEMRDMAHSLEIIHRIVSQLEIPDHEKR